MPPIEEADYIHKATVWVRTGYTRDDEPILDMPKPVCCRFVWSDRTVTDDRGNPMQINAEIALSMDLPQRSLVWFGKLENYNEEKDKELYSVVGMDKAYDLLGKNIRREYYLQRFRGSLPSGTVGASE